MTIANLNPAPFDSDENENDDLIKRKRVSHNRTQKRHAKEPVFTEKVNKVLESIYKNEEPVGDEEDETNLADFAPPPPPTSIGSERRATTDSKREAMQNLGSFSVAAQNQYVAGLGKQPEPIDEFDEGDVHDFQKNYGDNQSVDEFYKKYVPNYANANATMNFGSKPYNNSMPSPAGASVGAGVGANGSQVPMKFFGNDSIVSKLNYMIHLLEEKQDERTNNVTEEVILYSFLGIFIIFIVDSFSRIGKYTR
jgi:hypothetical protein